MGQSVLPLAKKEPGKQSKAAASKRPFHGTPGAVGETGRNYSRKHPKTRFLGVISE